MSDAMRVARALCALLILAMGVPAMAVAQYGSEAALPGAPALRAAGNFLPAVAWSSPAMDRRVRAVAARPGIAGQVLLVSQRQPEDEFKPISELPPEEKLPAAPMLVAAYVFVVLALFAYVLSIARRLNAVGRDIAKIESQLKRH